MNFGALNAIAINGSPLDAVVRAAITGYCFAVSAPSGTYIPEGAFRFRVNGVASADSTPIVRGIGRSPGVFLASAESAPVVHGISRIKGTYEALATSVPTPHYYQRYYASSPVFGSGKAEASPFLVNLMTWPVAGVCSADAVIKTHYLARSVLTGVCEAVGYIASEDIIKYKWDGPSDIRFLVPYVNNRFTVR